MTQRQHWLALLLIAVVAIAFRFPLLETVPPGLNFDEGGEGVAALDVAQGAYRLWWPIGGGKQPLMAYLVQPLLTLFGRTVLALRLYSALMGVGAVLASYFFAAQLFPPPQSPGPLRTFIPALTATGLATAFWHVAFSRIAFRAISTPLVEALAFGFFWLALTDGRRRTYWLAGAFIGGMIYTYLAGWFVPVVITLFLATEVLLARRTRQRPLMVQQGPRLLEMVGAATLVAGPLLGYFALNPGAFFDRGQAVSVFSAAAPGDLGTVVLQTTLTTLGTFFSLTGDPNPLANIPGRPELNSLLALFFGLGLIIALYRIVKQQPESANPKDRLQQRAYLLLLTGWLVMLLPAILAPDGAPHHLRLIGTAPFTYTFIALGLVGVGEAVASLMAKPDSRTTQLAIGWLCLLGVLGGVGWQTYHDYFVVWANQVDHYDPFDVFAVELAGHMTADTTPNAGYVIPMDLRAAHEARHYSLDYLYQGQTSYAYLPVDEPSLGRHLTEIAAGKTSLKVVRWTAFEKHNAADERETVAFALHTGGAEQVSVETFPLYDIETYRLPGPNSEFSLPAIETPIDVTFDGLIQVRRAEVLPDLTPAGEVAVAVTYAPVAPIDAAYRASVRLLGPDGAVVSQLDRTLRHNWHQPANLWPREEVNEYYLLPLSPEAGPGRYQVRLVVYHPETLAPLTDNGLAEIGLGTVEVSR